MFEQESMHCGCPRKQKHVHEIEGSTFIAERCKDPHNHRFATVSCEEICLGNDHFHEIKFRTDFYEDHFHEFSGKTCGAIPVGDGRHVHFIKDCTAISDCHEHEFRATTMIENPIAE